MLRSTVVAIAFVIGGPIAVRAQQVYTIQNWPEDVSKLPCEAFKKEPDGTWRLVAIVKIQNHAVTFEPGSEKSAKDSQTLNQRCK